MKLAFYRAFYSKQMLVLAILTCLLYIMGYALMLGLDKASSVTYRPLMLSIYTSFTQLGPMFFPFLVAYSINKDYSDKLTVFYRLLGIGSTGYLAQRLVSIAVVLFASILSANVVVAALFQDFSGVLQFTILYLNVALATVCVAMILAFFFKNMLLSIGLCFAYWIFGIVMLQINKGFGFLAYYDSTNTFFKRVATFASSHQLLMTHDFFVPFVVSGIFIVLVLGIGAVCDGYFFKAGIQD